MNIEEYREYCLSFSCTSEGFPFDEKTLVFKVMGKMFALADVNTFDMINLKCDPEKAVELRERYTCVQPGYHMNKKHWNSIYLDGSVSDDLIKQWIKHSYDLIVLSLPKKIQREWGVIT